MASRTVFIKQMKIAAVRIEVISLTSIIEEQIDIVDESCEPYNVIQRRIDMVKEALGCDDAEAERIVLNHS